jgi:hypothetical protein
VLYWSIGTTAPKPAWLAILYFALLEVFVVPPSSSVIFYRCSDGHACAARADRANRLASEIASAKAESRTSAITMTALQSYILGNSYIKVFSLDGDYAGSGDNEIVRCPLSPPI